MSNGWRTLSARQEHCLTRRQAVACGLHPATVDRMVLRGLWQRPFPGVLVTFSGPMPDLTRVWAAILYAGPGAVASHETAAWLHGLHDGLRLPLHVTVEATRRVTAQRGLRVHHSRTLTTAALPPRKPPRARIEDTVLDLVDAATGPDQVVDVILRACQRRLTTAARLAEAAASRRIRHRRLVDEVLEDAADGAVTALERRWRRGVEIPHGLPRGSRNKPEGPRWRRRYRDVRYERWRAVIELDGTAAHPPEEAHLDRARDRELMLSDERTLRYGWAEVLGAPCAAAIETADLLRSGGWPGPLLRCGPGCLVTVAVVA